jgi:hypothetical protein
VLFLQEVGDARASHGRFPSTRGCFDEKTVLPPLLPDGIACRLIDGHHPAAFRGSFYGDGHRLRHSGAQAASLMAIDLS